VAKTSGQKFISRNRAPRVQIQYEVELNGAQKKIELPFVMGVMSDLTGDTKDPKEVADRNFTEFDVDNFDEKMKAMKPSVKLTVPNTLTGEGQLPIEITFESMEDFSPAAIARKVEPLRQLLEARTQLSNLLTFMDGRTDAEELISKALNDRALLKSITATAKPTDGGEK
jgi:type VI secretion system protein ImpB